MPALAISAVAAATAAAVLVPMTAIGSASGHHRSVVPAPVGPADGWIVGFHGLVLTVPGNWHINDTRCGTPVADTVVRDEGGTPLCLIPRPKGISSVELVDNPASWTAQMRQVSDVTNAHGVHLRRGSIPGRGDTLVVPSVGVVMFIDTTSARTKQSIIDSIQLVDTDTTGCAMHEGALDPPASSQLQGGPFRRYKVPDVVPPHVASIAICHYVDDWLMSSTTVTGAAMDALVQQANAAPTGLAHAPARDYLPSICTESSSGGGEAGSGFVLHAHYAGQPDLLLWAHIGFCGRLGITNGLRSGQLSLALANAIATPLHTGFAMPGHLLPGPP